MGPEAQGNQAMNSRQRKQIYMHSNIFGAGTTSNDVYDSLQQQAVYQEVQTNIRRPGDRKAPDMSLPSPADIRCTQNAGHGAVMPSGRPRAQGLQGQPRQRMSNTDCLVTDCLDEAMPVVHANFQDDGAIPKEFHRNSVNLQWHDPRNEICRNRERGQESEDADARTRMRQEMSSEVFGTTRQTTQSTTAPGRELLSMHQNVLSHDSSLQQTSGASPPQDFDSQQRFARNLTASDPANFGARGYAPEEIPQPVAMEDPATLSRRRGEKNFSDLFGSAMPERREIGSRADVQATRTCSVLDPKGEIGVRNAEKWRVDVGSGDSPVHHVRKGREMDSSLFDRQAPARPDVRPEVQRVSENERVCHATRDIMDPASEIARRARLRDFEDGAGQNARDRKYADMSSAGMRMGMDERPMADGRGRQAPPENAPAGRGPATPAPDRPLTASQRKHLSMQSNIF